MKILVGLPEKTARGGINACEPPFLEELKNLEVEVCEEIYSFDNPQNISLFQRVRQVFKIAFKFRRLLKNSDFNLFFINTAFDKNAILRDVFTVFLIGKIKPKIFLKFHGSDANLLEDKNSLIFRFAKYLMKKVDGIGVLSSEEKQNFINADFDKNKFFVVKNAVTKFPENEINREFFISKEKPLRLLFVARLIETKGLFETIYAISELSKKDFYIRLDILGDGEIKNQAENLVNELNLSQIIHFHGHVSEENVQKFYQNCDVLVFPTYHQEGFPMVIFNAMANGLPIITTKIRAAADNLKDSENCLFCEQKNHLSVAEKILQMYENSDLRKQMSKNNFKLAKEFSAKKITPEYLKIFSHIANPKSKI